MAEPKPALRYHPNLAALYRDKVARLEDALNYDLIRSEAVDALRSLIDRIDLRPRKDGRGIDGILHGDLPTILSFCDEEGRNDELPGLSDPGSQLSLVAGARYPLYRNNRLLLNFR